MPFVKDCERVAGRIADFIQDTLRNAGRSKLVVGLSGGVDSAVAAALAVRAVGATNVRALNMPYKTSAPESLTDAREFAEKLTIFFEVVDISPIVNSYIARYSEMSAIRRGNLMARARMIVLFDHAHEDALVLGTGNKTEALLGYTTLYGDSACSLNPLGDLYKTDVRRLAEYLQIPHSIRQKHPSADLWPGQTDEGELQFSYDKVDRLLMRMIDEKAPRAQLLAEGFSARFIERVRDLILRNIFKRRLPPVAWLGAPYSTEHLESPDW